jgi:hypothetical protein
MYFFIDTPAQCKEFLYFFNHFAKLYYCLNFSDLTTNHRAPRRPPCATAFRDGRRSAQWLEAGHSVLRRPTAVGTVVG